MNEQKKAPHSDSTGPKYTCLGVGFIEFYMIYYKARLEYAWILVLRLLLIYFCCEQCIKGFLLFLYHFMCSDIELN